MQSNSVLDFFNMGGYAFYVWSSFGLTALVAVIEVGQVCAWHRKLLRQRGSKHRYRNPPTHEHCGYS